MKNRGPANSGSRLCSRSSGAVCCSFRPRPYGRCVFWSAMAGTGTKSARRVLPAKRAWSAALPGFSRQAGRVADSKTNCGRSVSRIAGWKSRQPGCVKDCKDFPATGVATGDGRTRTAGLAQAGFARVLEKNRQLWARGANCWVAGDRGGITESALVWMTRGRWSTWGRYRLSPAMPSMPGARHRQDRRVGRFSARSDGD